MTNPMDENIASTSSASGKKSPEEIIELLNEFGHEPHVTKEGTLFYRAWQIVEGFVKPEQAITIREKQQPRKQSDEIEWLSCNLENVRLSYANQWIAIYERSIVASAEDLPNLMDQVRQFEKPFITFIPEEEIIWDFAYGS